LSDSLVVRRRRRDGNTDDETRATVQRLPNFECRFGTQELNIEASHRAAGFDPLPRELILRRFFTFIDFLQSNGMTTRVVAKALDDVDDTTEFRNSDLTDDGFYFSRVYHGKWLNRMYKDQGDAKERALLAKWLQKFRES
jgi:hypothetical protein